MAFHQARVKHWQTDNNRIRPDCAGGRLKAHPWFTSGSRYKMYKINTFYKKNPRTNRTEQAGRIIRGTEAVEIYETEIYRY